MKYNIATNDQGHAVAITRNGQWVLHLKPGVDRNDPEVVEFVAMLNDAEQELSKCMAVSRSLMYQILGK